VTEALGWLGSFCFSVCVLPQLALVVRQGHARGTSKLFLWLWALGELAMLTYVPLKHGWDWPLQVNYGFNLACVCVLFRYVYWPRL
jgi:uncharacterized membrane protein YhaH (DUF805 family)